MTINCPLFKHATSEQNGIDCWRDCPNVFAAGRNLETFFPTGLCRISDRFSGYTAACIMGPAGNLVKPTALHSKTDESLLNQSFPEKVATECKSSFREFDRQVPSKRGRVSVN